MALSPVGAPLRNLVALKSFVKKTGGYILEALPEDKVDPVHGKGSFHYDESSFNGTVHSHAADINFASNERENLVRVAAVAQSMGLGVIYSLYGPVAGHGGHLHADIGSFSSLGRGLRTRTPGDLAVWDTQSVLHGYMDNLAGPDTKKRVLALREASNFGGTDFPFGVEFAQDVVGTTVDGDWGKNSRLAHDKAIRAVQTVWKAAGLYAPSIDTIWGGGMEAAYNKFLARY